MVDKRRFCQSPSVSLSDSGREGAQGRAEGSRPARGCRRGKVRIQGHWIDLAAPCLYLAPCYISDTFPISAPSAQPRQGACARTTNGPSIHLPYARTVEDLSG